MNVSRAYSHKIYALSFEEKFSARALPNAGVWLLERKIENTELFDLISVYPFSLCNNWQAFGDDLDKLRNGDKPVSLAMVIDPLNRPDTVLLQSLFNHTAKPFKQHFLIDFSTDPLASIASHHRRNARKAFKKLEIEFCRQPLEHADDWVRLYGELIRRHDIHGIAAFSDSMLRKQLQTPGLEMARAVHNNRTVGICLWMRDHRHAWYHLAAYSSLGYELGASFAIFHESIRRFERKDVEILNLGGGAGTTAKEDGLTRFKRGWSNKEDSAWFCGHVLDPGSYDALTERTGTSQSDFFPAYRSKGS